MLEFKLEEPSKHEIVTGKVHTE